MRFSKKQYYSELLEKNRTNIKGTWNILNEIIKKKKVVKDYPSYFFSNNDTILKENKPIADRFNEYFVNVGKNLANSIDSPKKKSWDDNSTLNIISESMFIQKTDETEIIDIVCKSKGKKSTDSNNLDMFLIKNIIDCIVKPLNYVCNLSLMTGKFPSKMKIAKVIPLFKSGDKHVFSNYRPISLLSQFSKILEKVFAKRLNDFISKHQILCEQQYGFRKTRTTSLALMDFVEQMTNATEKKQYTVEYFSIYRKHLIP